VSVEGVERRPMLPEFSYDTPCAKCGWLEVSVEYDRGMSVADTSMSPWFYDRGVFERQHLRRKCCRCGVHWKERPIDWDQEREDAWWQKVEEAVAEYDKKFRRIR
jgi:hypothetical protein